MSKANNLVAVDFETVWTTEYSLTHMSVFMYLHDPRFDAYLVAVDDGEDIRYVGPPAGFDWTRLNGMTVCAHNASFDYPVYQRLVETGVITAPMSTGPWVCTADMAAYLGVKRDLKTAAKYLLGEEVDKTVRGATKGRQGAELAQDPEVLAYGGKDADLCYRLAAAWLDSWPESEREISVLNRMAGLRGMQLDTDLVEAGVASLEPQLKYAESEIPWVAEGKPPLSPNALRAHGMAAGLDVPGSLAKDNPEFIAWAEEYGEKYPWVRAVGRYRSVNSLLKRVESLRDGYDRSSGRFPYGKKYFGAATGRFSGGGEGGGKFNMENMPKKVMFGVDLRPMFTAAPGHVLLIADYNQIEARYLLWRAGDTAALEPMFRGLSTYQAYAEAAGDAAPGSDIKNSDPFLYAYTKSKILGLGYQAGGPKFRAFAKLYGIDISEEKAAADVAEFREKNWRIVNYWQGHHQALAYSARLRDETHQVELASGRMLTYWHPRAVGREIEVTQIRGDFRSRMYGGKLTENEVQASCRDILCDAWRAVAKEYSVVLTVHDELVMEIPEDKADAAVPRVRELMVNCSPWTKGLPLGVDIKLSKFYTK